MTPPKKKPKAKAKAAPADETAEVTGDGSGTALPPVEGDDGAEPLLGVVGPEETPQNATVITLPDEAGEVAVPRGTGVVAPGEWPEIIATWHDDGSLCAETVDGSPLDRVRWDVNLDGYHPMPPSIITATFPGGSHRVINVQRA
jgi:hypothetical protein